MPDHQETPTQPESSVATENGDAFEYPPGDHALEVAARRGLGPLSPKGREVWHGHAMPCVSCGQLVERNCEICAHCGQDLSDDMIEKMLAYAGPWFVLEHVRPFPGVTLERIVRQILRGVLDQTSIVRGPETGHQWRFASETPGLCRYFGRCWNCHQPVENTATHCPACLSDQRFLHERRLAHRQASPPQANAVAPTPSPASGQQAADAAQAARQQAASLRRQAGMPEPSVVPKTPPSPPAPPGYGMPLKPTAMQRAKAASRSAMDPAAATMAANDHLHELSAALQEADPEAAPAHPLAQHHRPRVNPLTIGALILLIAIAGLWALSRMRGDQPTESPASAPIMKRPSDL